MRDYSLCGIPNRLAVEGERLVIQRFSSLRFHGLWRPLRICRRLNCQDMSEKDFLAEPEELPLRLQDELLLAV